MFPTLFKLSLAVVVIGVLFLPAQAAPTIFNCTASFKISNRTSFTLGGFQKSPTFMYFRQNTQDTPIQIDGSLVLTIYDPTLTENTTCPQSVSALTQKLQAYNQTWSSKSIRIRPGSPINVTGYQPDNPLAPPLSKFKISAMTIQFQESQPFLIQNNGSFFSNGTIKVGNKTFWNTTTVAKQKLDVNLTTPSRGEIGTLIKPLPPKALQTNYTGTFFNENNYLIGVVFSPFNFTFQYSQLDDPLKDASPSHIGKISWTGNLIAYRQNATVFVPKHDYNQGPLSGYKGLLILPVVLPLFLILAFIATV